MTAAREAVGLPLVFLTVVMFGGLEPGAPRPWTPPSVWSLVLAVLVLAILVRSGAFDPERLLHGSRGMLANANGFVVLLALFTGSAQVLHLLTPRSGLPALVVGLVMFLLLVNTLAADLDRRRVLRSLAIVLGSAFVLKFVILAALADPDGGRMRRVLSALLDLATLGSIAQDPLHPAAGYIAFGLVILYVVGVALLPRRIGSTQLPTSNLQLPLPNSQLAASNSQRYSIHDRGRANERLCWELGVGSWELGVLELTSHPNPNSPRVDPPGSWELEAGS